MKITSSLIIGAGQMGAGIAQVFATSGITVSLYDPNEVQILKASKDIDKSIEKLIEKGKLEARLKPEILNRIDSITVLPETIKADIVIEAIPENMDAKQSLFRDITKRISEKTILATNTSSLSITRIASVANHPQNVIGMHFMNPVPLMGLVEIIRGLQTSDATYESVVALTQVISKVPITAEHDYPGFIVNRILVPMINEAFFVLMEGIATPHDIDEAMKLGTSQPMGPLALADFVGLDTCLFICETFHRELGEDKYRPCPLLRKYVEAGWYGRKAGRGVYQYE
jgi:3-hydroxybutyryl-CoA dehydrogenase